MHIAWPQDLLEDLRWGSSDTGKYDTLPSLLHYSLIDALGSTRPSNEIMLRRELAS